MEPGSLRWSAWPSQVAIAVASALGSMLAIAAVIDIAVDGREQRAAMHPHRRAAISLALGGARA